MSDSQTWLNRILAGETPTAETIDELRKCPEDLHLDLKGGEATGDKKKRNDIVREYASAFSNSDGGLLVFGVNDSTKALVPCEPVGDRTLDEWAKSCLIGLAHLLQPPPRFHTVEIAGGQALVIAFARAPQLVPVIKGGKWLHFLRFHDANTEIPEYLLADLMLGRRQHPMFRVAAHKSSTPALGDGPVLQDGVATQRLRFTLTVENTTLIPAADVEVGVVGWSCGNNEMPLGDYLAMYVTGTSPSGPPSVAQWTLTRRVSVGAAKGGPGSLRAFGSDAFPVSGDFTLPVVVGRCRASFAVYVCASGHPPLWFELRLAITTTLDGTTHHSTTSDLVIEPAVGRRPELSWMQSVDAEM